MKVLLSAFACDPRHGSEPGNGWGWASSLADAGCDVVALVTDGNRTTLEHELSVRPRETLRFEFVPVPGTPFVRGSLRAKLRYLLWQVAAARRARRLVRTERFDVVHHVTFGSLQGGSLLGRLGVPFVFGPVGGGQTAERELSSWFGRAWVSERMRTCLTRMAGAIPPARSAVRRAAVVVAVNDDTAELALHMGARAVVPMLDSALTADRLPDVPAASGRDTGRPFRILWLGRALPRKGLNLAVRAFDRAGLSDAELVVLGDGPCREEAARLAGSLGCDAQVRFLGHRPHAEVGAHLAEADMLLFTSLRETFGNQLMEASAYGLPLVVLDHHGAGDRLPDDMARKVPIAAPEILVETLGEAIRGLATSPEVLRSMGEASRRFALAHTWPEQAARMVRLYERVIDDAPPTTHG